MKQFFFTAIINVFCLVLPQPSFAQENIIKKQHNPEKQENLVTKKADKSSSYTSQLPLNSTQISEQEIKEFLIKSFEDIAKKIAKYNYSPKYEHGKEFGNNVIMQ